MGDNPIDNIEDKKAQEDMGLMAIRVYHGALVEAENKWEAFLAACAYFSGMFHPNPSHEKEDEDEETP